MKIAVTGANGFIGSAVCTGFRAAMHEVVPITRLTSTDSSGSVAVGDIDIETDWQQALQGVDCVVHCAARVHVMNDQSADPLTAFRAVNTHGTLRLARQAVLSGVKRLVFISSLKVLGERTEPGRPYTANSAPQPQDPYGVSKWEAEAGLREIESLHGLEVVVIRPPLVIGPGAKANVQRLVRAISRGIPLPLGRIQNQRSMLGLSNLSDLVILCATSPAAAHKTFLASDGLDVSTPQFIREIGLALGQPARLLPMPIAGLRLAGRLTGRLAQVERLTESLQVEIGHTQKVLGWTPRVTLQEELQNLVQDYLA
jgi:nucleoside-diphosphate-sugar epimerase